MDGCGYVLAGLTRQVLGKRWRSRGWRLESQPGAKPACRGFLEFLRRPSFRPRALSAGVGPDAAISRPASALLSGIQSGSNGGKVGREVSATQRFQSHREGLLPAPRRQRVRGRASGILAQFVDAVGEIAQGSEHFGRTSMPYPAVILSERDVATVMGAVLARRPVAPITSASSASLVCSVARLQVYNPISTPKALNHLIPEESALRVRLKIRRGPVFEEKAGWRGATREHTRQRSVTEEQRSQPAFSSKTLRATVLLGWACVGSAVTARCGDAPASPPWPSPKSLVAGPLPIFRRALRGVAAVGGWDGP